MPDQRWNLGEGEKGGNPQNTLSEGLYFTLETWSFQEGKSSLMGHMAHVSEGPPGRCLDCRLTYVAPRA